MSVRSIRPFEPVVKDAMANFHGKQIVYLGWDQHLMFYAPVCVPLPPAMPFQALMDAVLPQSFGAHPEFERIDWGAVQWSRDGEAFTPAPGKTLVENGITHKTIVRMRTPGLNGLQGVGF